MDKGGSAVGGGGGAATAAGAAGAAVGSGAVAAAAAAAAANRGVLPSSVMIAAAVANSNKRPRMDNIRRVIWSCLVIEIKDLGTLRCVERILSHCACFRGMGIPIFPNFKL